LARQVRKIEDSVIVYDDQKLSQIDAGLFDPTQWPDAVAVTGQGGRQAAVRFVSRGLDVWALRHYYRGGLVGRVLSDQFLWTGPAKVRSFLEWDLLQKLVKAGLPAPAPVAARFVRTGLWYTADLLTERIPDVEPFSTRLQRTENEPDLWGNVGECIAMFHQAGFFHADLNAHNLQVDAENNVWLLDWDRGELRSAGNWREANLARLQRSCQKISRHGGAKFRPADWDALLQGYQQGLQA
jgi:3-deoxy-D-manno-octulosonic acid kinase